MSTATATVVKMMESLPESYQNQVVERERVRSLTTNFLDDANL